MGPSSRTFFSHNGFTCLQVLDHIRAFYQENMSRQEIGAAIHSDSRHADRIRSMFKIPFYPNSIRFDFLIHQPTNVKRIILLIK
ncbi:hypothetical protein glysoja_047368 [Glycine soja]|uniref:Uncharacterized protein n=1 Tax=Glycine soja TaxID=3848 RepID=A0A0B2PC89_GLYSO|nr:hypothetical protein glysoja_047368 [Glycine soja]